MNYYNGISVGDGILPEKNMQKQILNMETNAIFMTYEQLLKKWNKGKEDKQ